MMSDIVCATQFQSAYAQDADALEVEVSDDLTTCCPPRHQDGLIVTGPMPHRAEHQANENSALLCGDHD